MAEPGEPLPNRLSASMGTRKVLLFARAVELVRAGSVGLPMFLRPLRIWAWMVARLELPSMRSWLVVSRVVLGERVREPACKRMVGVWRWAVVLARMSLPAFN